MFTLLAQADTAVDAGKAIALALGIGFALRAASKEMKISQMKSDFVSNVSHELRTPLASIRVFGEFLKLGRASTPEKVKEYLIHAGQFIGIGRFRPRNNGFYGRFKVNSFNVE